ncbi:MAG: tRNA (adenosine(37)-N6)-dimethylallyltransferase MiaA [Bacteroidaceae bacterium]|nr:tRNA (adenosine(37)-N6)-dimethylallyltransferase MiaA [Bacteroidaceae bacterium]
MYDLLTITGPTACGKTSFAANVAYHLGGEILSADSRQVYRRMDIGTGKDLADYTVNGTAIPYHLIDIAEPGTKYNVYRFQHDFHIAYADIKSRGKLPILCGGTGLYVESILKNYEFDGRQSPALNSLVIGLSIDRDTRREKISRRLNQRLDEGMVDEIIGLLDSGVSAEALISYGLEYKYVTQYVLGQLTFEEMHDLLEIAIHQFAKRQMTWFRGMEERRGTPIHWLDVNIPLDERIQIVKDLLTKE